MIPQSASFSQSISRFTVAVVIWACFAVPASAQKKTNNVAVILPFCARQIIDHPNAGYEELGNVCREYYQGMLIAMDSFSRAHVAVNLSVFDNENDSALLMKLLQKNEVKNADLIIGPVKRTANRVMAGFAKERGIYHVSPLMTLARTYSDDPFWMSANPDLPAYGSFLYNYITAARDSANIIVVGDKSSFDKSVSSGLKKFGTGNGRNIRIRYVEYGKGVELVKHLSRDLPNHVVIPVASESTVNAILRQVKDTTDGFDITCYGFPKWLEFKNTDHAIFERLRVHIATPFFVDYSQEAVKQFIMAYRERFFTEPSESAFKGYDQALVLIGGLSQSGKSFVSELSKKSVPALHTTFEFRQSDGAGSFQNCYLNMVRLEDLRLRKVTARP